MAIADVTVYGQSVETAGTKTQRTRGTSTPNTTKQPRPETDGHKISNLVMRTLYESMEPVDLIDTLTQKAKDPLLKYRNSEGEINRDKVPDKLYIVAIVTEIMEAARKQNLALCVRHGVIYGFNGVYWDEISDEKVKQALSLMAIRLGYPSPAAAKVSDFRDKIFKQLIAEGIEEAPEPPKDGPTLINLANGTLEVTKEGVRLREHRMEDFLTYCLDYAYDETAKCPIFDRYLLRVLPDEDDRKILQEFLGYAFTKGLKLEKALVLYGDGSNGKSVLFEVVTQIFGEENIAHKGLGELCRQGERGNNHRAELENKLLNYASELNPEGANVDIFKAFVTQEPVTARRLYKNPFTYRPTAKLIFNTNKLPAEAERTDAYFRRFLIIPFKVKITDEEKDPNLHKKIIEHERPGVLNWIIAGLLRIVTNQKFTQSKNTTEAVEAYKREINSVAQFVEEYGITPSRLLYIPVAKLYADYSEFCDEAGFRRLNRSNFGKELIALGFEQRRVKENGKTVRCYMAQYDHED